MKLTLRIPPLLLFVVIVLAMWLGRGEGRAAPLWLVLVATLVQLAFVFIFASQAVLKQQMVLSPYNGDATLTTREFSLPSGARSLRIKHDTDVDNNWVDITTTLIEKGSGEAYQSAQEISYYRGVDDGESWSEGSRDTSISYKDVPAGNYYLVIEYDLGKDRPSAVSDNVQVVRNPAGWSNYVLVMIFLTLFPL